MSRTLPRPSSFKPERVVSTTVVCVTWEPPEERWNNFSTIAESRWESLSASEGPTRIAWTENTTYRPDEFLFISWLLDIYKTGRGYNFSLPPQICHGV